MFSDDTLRVSKVYLYNIIIIIIGTSLSIYHKCDDLVVMLCLAKYRYLLIVIDLNCIIPVYVLNYKI